MGSMAGDAGRQINRDQSMLAAARLASHCFCGAASVGATTKCKGTPVWCAYQINGESHLLSIEEVL
jgi:hypothetical protein